MDLVAVALIVKRDVLLGTYLVNHIATIEKGKSPVLVYDIVTARGDLASSTSCPSTPLFTDRCTVVLSFTAIVLPCTFNFL